ncbi:hypothetical protein F2Q69_00040480 [Brassica cretica]|uniref:Uncharacterized protein n=1 Tax=Brassica cretica TaxID=69181 RepID=A0A8S9NDK6_BRACR|nr:hypothetical protein F2Q69_00040480 [Brassica cretica]
MLPSYLIRELEFVVGSFTHPGFALEYLTAITPWSKWFACIHLLHVQLTRVHSAHGFSRPEFIFLLDGFFNLLFNLI